MIVKKDDIIYGIYSYDEMFGEEINCTEFKVISVKNNKIIVQDENKDLYTYNNFEELDKDFYKTKEEVEKVIFEKKIQLAYEEAMFRLENAQLYILKGYKKCIDDLIESR